MSGKLFLGGLSTSTTKETLQYYFGQFGNVVDAVVMANRGFGFVTFDSADAADHALGLEHVIDERTIEVKAADGQGGKGGPQSSQRGGQPSGLPYANPGGPYANTTSYKSTSSAEGEGSSSKIFVGGLPPNTAEDKLRSYFQAYGNLIDCVVMKDRATGKPRGFGFVQYDNAESADRVMNEYAAHKIEGKWVEVKRADQKGGPKGGGKGEAPPGKSSALPYASYQPYTGYEVTGGGISAAYAGYGAAPDYGASAAYGAYGAAYGGAYGAAPSAAPSVAPTPAYGSAYGGSDYGGGKAYAPPPSYGGGKGKGKSSYSPY